LKHIAVDVVSDNFCSGSGSSASSFPSVAASMGMDVMMFSKLSAVLYTMIRLAFGRPGFEIHRFFYFSCRTSMGRQIRISRQYRYAFLCCLAELSCFFFFLPAYYDGFVIRVISTNSLLLIIEFSFSFFGPT
jgi:hypothetical protein